MPTGWRMFEYPPREHRDGSGQRTEAGSGRWAVSRRQRENAMRGAVAAVCRLSRLVASSVRALTNFPISKAGNRMIVDHPNSLHEGIANGRPDKPKAAPFQILRHRIRLPCA